MASENDSATRTTTVKCVVWDLDNTIWDGILLEDGDVVLKPGIVDTLTTLDERGILLSIASRNDEDAAFTALSDFGIDHLFLAPQIGWGAKSESIEAIAADLNIQTKTIAFVDDDPFERAEVAAVFGDVMTIDAADMPGIADLDAMQPRFVTEDSRRRRRTYQDEERRKEAAESMSFPEFLASLDLELSISDASHSDLERVEELTVRTTQLNSTGETFSFEELDAFRTSDDHRLLVAGLNDRFGEYGKVGIALIDASSDTWRLPLFLVSCRVMSRGVGSVFLSHVLQTASAEGATIVADFIRTSRNRPMFMAYKMAGFVEVHRDGNRVRLAHDGQNIAPIPSHVRVIVEEAT